MYFTTEVIVMQCNMRLIENRAAFCKKSINQLHVIQPAITAGGAAADSAIVYKTIFYRGNVFVIFALFGWPKLFLVFVRSCCC